jgi:hypothetical protein
MVSYLQRLTGHEREASPIRAFCSSTPGTVDLVDGVCQVRRRIDRSSGKFAFTCSNCTGRLPTVAEEARRGAADVAQPNYRL